MTMQMNKTRLQDQFDCFMSSGKWEDGSILIQHERESVNGYTRRKNGFSPMGLYQYLIRTYGILFAKNPTRTDADETFEMFVEDCGYGMNLDSFMERSLQISAALGSVAIVMDADKYQPSSKESMILGRTFPFMEMVLPQRFTDLVVDRVGRLKAFAYEYYETTDESQSILYEKRYANGKVIKSHNTVDDEGNQFRVIDGEADLPMGIIPVIIMVPSREPLVTSRVPSSPTFGLYKQELNIAVTNSLMDEAFYSQQFSILTTITDAEMSNITLGSSNILKLPIGSSASFISPSGTPIDMMLKRVELSASSMIKTFANMLTNNTTQSGEAKVIDRQVGALQLKNVANYLQEVEYKIYELFMAFMGEDVIMSGYKYTVTYFKDFDLTDIAGYIAQATDVLALNISDDAKAEIRANVLRKFLSGEDPSTVTKIVELEAKNKEPQTTVEDQVV